METDRQHNASDAPAVLHVVHSLERAGTESQCARIAIACARQGQTVGIAVSNRTGDFLAPVEAACGSVLELGTGRLLSRRTPQRVRALRRFVRDHSIALVHAWDAAAVLFGSWAARAEAIPVITSLRDLGEIYASWKLRLMLSRHRRAAAVVTNAEAVKRVLVNRCVDAETIRVIPNAIAEYFAACLPVVATNVGGAPELVRPGANGYLIPVGDAAALAAHVRTLAADPVLRTAFGAAGRRYVESHCSLPIITGRFLALYRSLGKA